MKAAGNNNEACNPQKKTRGKPRMQQFQQPLFSGRYQSVIKPLSVSSCH
jgi:hypothetical protein